MEQDDDPARFEWTPEKRFRRRLTGDRHKTDDLPGTGISARIAIRSQTRPSPSPCADEYCSLCPKRSTESAAYKGISFGHLCRTRHSSQAVSDASGRTSRGGPRSEHPGRCRRRGCRPRPLTPRDGSGPVPSGRAATPNRLPGGPRFGKTHATDEDATVARPQSSSTTVRLCCAGPPARENRSALIVDVELN